MNDEIKLENIKAVGDKIIIEVFTKINTNSDWEFPEEQYTATPVVAKVIARGEDSIYDIGDLVFFRRYSVDELKFKIDGKDRTVSIISDEEVVAIIKK